MTKRQQLFYPSVENEQFIAAHADGKPTAFLNAVLDFYRAARRERAGVIGALADIAAAIRAQEARDREAHNDDRKP